MELDPAEKPGFTRRLVKRTSSMLDGASERTANWLNRWFPHPSTEEGNVQCINQIVAARPLLNHDLHAIDALPARRRGGVGLSAWSRRRREMQSRPRRGIRPSHLISTQVFTSSWMLKQGQFAEQCALLLAGSSALIKLSRRWCGGHD